MKYSLFIRILFLSCLLLLQSCIQSSGDKVAEGGIGGTGVTMGRIDGFGSIIVNGIKFNTDSATLLRNNNSVANQESYAIGEVVTITGRIDTTTRTGVAQDVSFSHLVKGPVTNKPPLLSSNLNVLGQTIHINDLTIMHGFALISDLNPADIVEVSGFTDANGIIQASSITLNNEAITTFNTSGTVTNFNGTNKTFILNNSLTINFANAETPLEQDSFTNGKMVNVTGQLFFNTVFYATKITSQPQIMPASGSIIELEGIITRFVSPQNFDINNRPVIVTSETIFKDGAEADLALNTSIEIEGTIDTSGRIVVEAVELQQVESLHQIEAPIQSIDYQNKTMVVFGQTIHANRATLFYDESEQKDINLSFERLNVDDYIDAKLQIRSDGSFLAIRLSREEREIVPGTNTTQISFKGDAENINASDSSFVLFGIQMISDENTAYLDSKENPVSKANLFAAIQAGNNFIEVEGEAAGTNTVLMHTILVDFPVAQNN